MDGYAPSHPLATPSYALQDSGLHMSHLKLFIGIGSPAHRTIDSIDSLKQRLRVFVGPSGLAGPTGLAGAVRALLYQPLAEDVKKSKGEVT